MPNNLYQLLIYLRALLSNFFNSDQSKPVPAPPKPTHRQAKINDARRKLKEFMQTPNQSTKSRYNGPVASLLQESNVMELSQITRDHLEKYATNNNATHGQRSRLLALWTGQQEVSPELRQVLHEIAFPKEK